MTWLGGSTFADWEWGPYCLAGHDVMSSFHVMSSTARDRASDALAGPRVAMTYLLVHASTCARGLSCCPVGRL